MGSLNGANPTGMSMTQTTTMVLELSTVNRPILPLREGNELSVQPLLEPSQDMSFSIIGTHIRPFEADMTIYTDAFNQGWGTHFVDLQISGNLVLNRQVASYQLLGTESGLPGTPTLG